jgi:hypothetical protein
MAPESGARPTVVPAGGGDPLWFLGTFMRVKLDGAQTGGRLARMLVLSTPAGIEQYARALAEPAQWPWLPPPPDGPRVPADRMEAVERELSMVRHGPPPPPIDQAPS